MPPGGSIDGCGTEMRSPVTQALVDGLSVGTHSMSFRRASRSQNWVKCTVRSVESRVFPNRSLYHQCFCNIQAQNACCKIQEKSALLSKPSLHLNKEEGPGVNLDPLLCNMMSWGEI